MRRLGLNAQFFKLLEASLLMLFFVQALRFLIGATYSRVASASIIALLPPEAIPQISDAAGFVDPAVVNQEVMFLVYMLFVPILTVLVGRFRVFLLFAALMVAGGRTLMVAETGVTAATASALAVGGGLFYVTLISRHRPSVFPYMMILAFAADQLFRAAGNTLDPSWSVDYFPIQLSLFFLAVILGFANYVVSRRETNSERGLMTFWGGLAFGAMLFLELALLSLPNAIAGRARVDYTTIVPILLVVTLLPLLGGMRLLARQIIGLFDVTVRGWVWLLLTALMLVLGTRFNGVVSAVGFVIAQFTVSMIWWWLVRPQGERERNFSGLWIFFGVLIFALLVLFDTFTYEYAYVQPFALDMPQLNDLLNDVLLPILRGFRGLGYAVILLGTFIATLPIILTQRRIAWRGGGTWFSNVLRVFVVGSAAAGGAFLSAPPLITGVSGADSIRVGTYNIHGGYTEFYDINLEGVAQTINQSGAGVILLQEIEAGRLTSFGIDQPLWLARRLGMDVDFFPTNEGLQGLAVLSRAEIVFSDGEILTGTGQQTGLQRVQILPAENTVVTIYNTWLGLLLDSADSSIEEQEQDQQRQLNDIIGIINRHHPNRQLGFTVVGGTFNNIPDSPLIQRMDSVGFSDPFAGLPIERAATLVRTGLSARVDYVWIYPEIAVGANVMPTDASDHRLAFVGLMLSASP